MILLLSGGSTPDPVDKKKKGFKSVEIKKMFNIQESDQMFPEMSHLAQPDWI